MALVLSAALAGWTVRVQAVDLGGLSLACLVAASDTILVGRVEPDPAGAYHVDVEETLSGQPVAGRVRFSVSPWQGPTNKPSGRALLFLRSTAGRGGWEAVGPSAEGWRTIASGRVDLSGLTVGVDWAPPAAGLQGQEAEQVARALRELAACVTWRRDLARRRITATFTCEEPRRVAAKGASAFAGALMASVEATAEAGGVPCLALGGRAPD